MSRRFVEQLKDGDEVEEIYLVSDKQLRANRNGNLYLQFDLRDRTGVIGARMWNVGDSLAREFEAGDFVMVDGKVQLFQGSLQLIASHTSRVAHQKVVLADFMPHSPQPIPQMLQRLRGSLMKLGNPHLRALAECYLMDEEFLRGFQNAPAGVRIHHAYVGGLLEHTLAMMDLAEKVAPLYPDVDKDLLMIGVFLHDSGKIHELSYHRVFGYSDEGQLVGHLAIGSKMLHEKSRRVQELLGEPFPRDLLLRVEHMILSHHGTLEFGSPKVPMTLEAILLHEIDSLDTRVNIALREIREDRNQASAWTPFNPALGRRLYKGGESGDLYSPTLEAYD